MNRALCFYVSLAFAACHTLAAENVDLQKTDPVTIKRTASPFDDLFVREEFIQYDAVPSSRLRMSVVSKKGRNELLKFSDDRIETPIPEKWEWRDVTGDGKPELLVWQNFDWQRTRASQLEVYRFEPNGEFGSALRLIGTITYANWAGMVYPTRPPTVSGFLTFGEDSKTVDWHPNPGTEAKPSIVRWIWDSEKNEFVENKGAGK